MGRRSYGGSDSTIFRALKLLRSHFSGGFDTRAVSAPSTTAAATLEVIVEKWIFLAGNTAEVEL